MRSIAPLALAVLTAACFDRPVPTSIQRPAFELVDPGQRRAVGTISAHAYGSFRVNASGGATSVIMDGPANFPGHPRGTRHLRGGDVDQRAG